MSEPFLGEIRAVPFNFAPRGWALCDGQLLPIAQNTALFSLLGTTYGGNGQTTFALPDLRGRTPLQPGQAPGLSQVRLGERGGAERVTLTDVEIPAHRHNAVGAATTNHPGEGTLPSDGGVYAEAATTAAQAHENMPPYLAVYFVIALQGIYPPRA